MHHKTRQTALYLALLLLAVTTAKAQFDIEDSHTTANLRGVSNVGGGVVWASGENGTVRRSEDEGYLWQLCTIPPGAEKLDFRGIQAFDANTAIVMSSGKGDLSRLYKTTDGCQTWKLLFTNPDKEGFWDAIQFDRSGRNAYLIGDPVHDEFALFVTEDSGNNWKRWGSPQEHCGRRTLKSMPKESLFAASNGALVNLGPYFAFVSGGSSGARFTINNYDNADAPNILANRCWPGTNSINIPLSRGAPSTGAFAIASATPSGGTPSPFVVVGGDYLHPDEGRTAAATISVKHVSMPGSSPWEAKLSATPPHGYRSAVAYEPTTKTWITVGPNGTDISTDDGRNWRALKPNLKDSEAPDADKNWNALSLPFAVGPHGRIGKLRTNDLTSKGVQ